MNCSPVAPEIDSGPGLARRLPKEIRLKRSRSHPLGCNARDIASAIGLKLHRYHDLRGLDGSHRLHGLYRLDELDGLYALHGLYETLIAAGNVDSQRYDSRNKVRAANARRPGR